MYKKEFIQEVCQWLLQNEPARDVAARFGISYSTVAYFAKIQKIRLPKIKRPKASRPKQVRQSIPNQADIARRAKELTDSLRRSMEIADLVRKGVRVEELRKRFDVSSVTLRFHIKRYNLLFPEKQVSESLGSQKEADNRQHKLDIGKKVYQARVQQATWKQIAERYQCSAGAAYICMARYCKTHGLSHPRVDASSMRILSVADAYKMIEERKSGATLRELSCKYGVSVGTVSLYCVEIGKIRCKLPKRESAATDKRWSKPETFEEPIARKRAIVLQEKRLPVDLSNLPTPINADKQDKNEADKKASKIPVMPEVTEAELQQALERYPQYKLNRKRINARKRVADDV
jgi:transposase